MRIVSIDIGSTWTKGALFLLEGEDLVLAGRAHTPTTSHLPDGFFRVERELLGSGGERPVHAWSSSAHGGLSVAALGLVPDLTLQAAQAAALSAGAKITSVYSYQLNSNDIARLNRECPDILLFSGGTDGGNTSFVEHNAKILRDLDPATVILYAGNRDAVDLVTRELSDHPLVFAGNVLPDLREPCPESAREAIRRVFLDRIVEGKGLSELVRHTGTEPRPTPLAMLEFVQAIGQAGNLGRFVLVDMGGATTDIYSHGQMTAEEETVLTHGLPEPVTKRTVEGDLGMRISAASAVEAAAPWVQRLQKSMDVTDETLQSWVTSISADPGRLPADELESDLDELLSLACIGCAVSRHAGRMEIVYTANGPTELRRGKDLRRYDAVVCSGGFSSRGNNPQKAFDILPFDERGRVILTPNRARILYDREYLFPLLANAFQVAGRPAVKKALISLTEQSPQK